MRSAQVRKTFLDYFGERGHRVVPSSPVVPAGDKTLLFTNAGMVQFKDIFTGLEKAPHPRAASVQKCIRAGGKHNDLDNVGYTTRHLTFFEMLGNFSFGDYFKREAIAYAWELVTKGYGLDPKDLWVTVYREDDEARRLWREVAGVAAERIVPLGEKDNFWSMGEVGPCGPCSEILVDRGDAFGEATIENGERFFEFWNLVFMEYEQSADGSRRPLPRPSIDTGMGLERMAMVLQDATNVFETDILGALIRKVEELSGVAYSAGEGGVPHRVLADHVRSLAFALADGAEISNEGRGYVLRRILRRAARYGRKIRSEGTIVWELLDTLVREMGDAYPEIARKKDSIALQIRMEEERFGETLDRGIALFEEVAARLRKERRKVVPGEDVFRLYDTFGFPVDLVERMAEEAGLRVDVPGFERLMEEQKERSRGAATFFVPEVLEKGRDLLERVPPTHFEGYTRTGGEGELQAAFEADGTWNLVLSDTPFYAEAGGQIGDTGSIESGRFRLRVKDTQRQQGRFIHVCELLEGDPAALRPGEVVRLAVDEERRRAIERHHSATHLLHAALRQILGTHVHQKGSLVADSRLRFDVSHFAAMSPEEIDRVSELVRSKVLENIPVETREMDYDEAIAAGALAFFGEKYGDRVRVVRMGDFSMELCGGTHVERTGAIGSFLIAGEGSVSAGIRRLEALAAEAAESAHRDNAKLLEELSRTLKVKPEALRERVARLVEENRTLRARLEKQMASSAPGRLERRRIGDVVLYLGLYDGVSARELRSVYDGIKKESDRMISGLLARGDGKVQVLVTVSPRLVKEGWNAGKVFDAAAGLLEARGGGRPEMVQAGGTAPEAAEDALRAIEDRVRKGP